MAILATLPQPIIAQTYRIDTLLGNFDPFEEVPLSRAWTDAPSALAIDSAGNIYFAEARTSRVRKVDLTGQVSTVAGSGLTGDSGDGGPATHARFGRIEGLAVDLAGNIYVADAESNRIRRVDASGTIETVAGTGEFGWDGDGGPATEAKLTAMAGLATDGNGNLYVADTWADRIRKIDAHGTISTIAGTGVEGRAGDGGPAIEAQFNRPHGMAIDESGVIFVADTYNHLVRRVDRDGTISTFAGNGDRGYSGDGGLATAAELSLPHAVAVDRSGNVYIADTRNGSVRKVDPSGIITTVAGRGPRGRRTGQGAEVRLSHPRSLASSSSGEVYIADEWGGRVYQIGDDGKVRTFVGLGQREIPYPRAVAVDPDGQGYVVFSGAHSVVKVDPTGKITPFAGTGNHGFSGDGGPAVDAKLASPGGLELDDRGNVYIADSSNHRIRMVDTSGTIETIAGTGTRGFSGDGGPATSASFNYPADVAVGPDGAIYVNDRQNRRIRKIDRAGIVTTIAGSGTRGRVEPDSLAVLAPLRPEGLDVDSSGRVHIVDRWALRVYMVDTAGILRVAVGNGGRGVGGDGGPARDAELVYPEDIAISDTDTLYIADSLGAVIRKVTRDGIITTIAGTTDAGYNGDGSPSTAFQLRFPKHVAVQSDRRVLLVDALNHRIRVLTAEFPPPSVSSVSNGASHTAGLAPGSVGVIQGADLSSYSSAATALPHSDPLPTSLLGTSVIVAGTAGMESTTRLAGIFSVSPTEITFHVPLEAPLGQATLAVQHHGALSEPVDIHLSRVAPGLFSANGDGQGVAAATAVRVESDGTRTSLDVSRFDPERERHVAVPLDVRANFSPVYLTIYGTGMSNGRGQPSVKIRGRFVAVQSAGPAIAFPGIDELVVGPLPTSIHNREVEVVAVVDGQASNAVTIAFK